MSKAVPSFVLCGILLTLIALGGCADETVAESSAAVSMPSIPPAATPSPTAAASVPPSATADWRTAQGYSADVAYSNDLTLCFLPADGGAGVYNAETGQALGILSVPEEWLGAVPAAEPYLAEDRNGDGAAELCLLMVDGTVLSYGVEQAEDGTFAFPYLTAEAPLPAALHRTEDAALLSGVSYPFVYDADKDLSKKQKKLYESIKEDVLGVTPFRYVAKTVGYDTLDNVFVAWQALSHDYPDVDNFFMVYEEINSKGVTVALSSQYNTQWRDGDEDIDQVRADNRQYEEACQNILAGMPEGLSTAQKYYYLGKAVCDSTAYDYSFSSPGIAVPGGALFNGLSICQGYAKVYQSLCQKAGLFCGVVGGASRGESHAWNLVRLESGTYHVDLTWADEMGETGSDAWMKYFLLTQDEILTDHEIQDGTMATGTPLGLPRGTQD